MMWRHGARGTEQMPVSRDTGERAVKLFGHSALGWGAHIREFLQRREGAAMRLVCTQLHETVDGRWTFPWVRRGRWGDGDGDDDGDGDGDVDGDGVGDGDGDAGGVR